MRKERQQLRYDLNDDVTRWNNSREVFPVNRDLSGIHYPRCIIDSHLDPDPYGDLDSNCLQASEPLIGHEADESEMTLGSETKRVFDLGGLPSSCHFTREVSHGGSLHEGGEGGGRERGGRVMRVEK